MTSVTDATAQYNLGLIYTLGKGVEQDYPQALHWFTKAANQGSAEALYGLLQLPPPYLRNAAVQGDATAQYYLGLMYSHGESVEQDYPLVALHVKGTIFSDNNVKQNHVLALGWYTKAAAQGESRAQMALGWSYAEGKGVEQDYDQAQQWFDKAAVQGHVTVMKSQDKNVWHDNVVKLPFKGAMYRDGEGVEQNYLLALHYFHAEWEWKIGLECGWDGEWDGSSLSWVLDKLQQPLHWYVDAATQGDPLAQYYLGMIYNSGATHALGEGAEQDDSQALHWLEQAADQGITNQELLDKLRAIQHTKKAAFVGDAAAQYTLGLMYHQYYLNDACSINDTEALHWFEMAAAQGHATAQYSSGLLHHYVGDINQASHWFNKAASHGITAVQNELMQLVVAEQVPELAHAGNAAAQCRLGLMYRMGDYVTKDYAQALAWLHKSADQGYLTAYDELWEMYSLQSDNKQALQWIDKAATQGYAKAQCRLGLMHRLGYGGLEQDYAQALYWFKQAAAQEDAEALYHLGWMYTWSEGVEQNKEQARDLFERAADRGHKESQSLCRK